LAAGAVSQRNRYRTFSGFLADYVFIQLCNDLARGQFLERYVGIFSRSRQVNRHRSLYSWAGFALETPKFAQMLKKRASDVRLTPIR
jgi:hypothetical protein